MLLTFGTKTLNHGGILRKNPEPFNVNDNHGLKLDLAEETRSQLKTQEIAQTTRTKQVNPH